MSNVIRPTFGGVRRDEPQPEDLQVMDVICIYGEEAGYRVGLVQDDSGPEGLVFRVFVGEIESDEVEAVAVLAPTPQGRIDADAIGMAILRTLDIIGSTLDGSGVA